MQADFAYPIQAGGYGNPLDSTYQRPVVHHLAEVLDKYPSLSQQMADGRISLVDQTITLSVPAGSTVNKTLNLSGGRDILVFERKVSASLTEAPTAGASPAVYAVLPNERLSYLDIAVKKRVADDDEGEPIIDEGALSAVMAYEFDPNEWTMPQLWLASEKRQIQISNNTGDDLEVAVTWTLVSL